MIHCRGEGFNINNQYITKIGMKITLQNKEHEFGAEMKTRKQIQNLITACVNKLTDSVGIASHTLEMQVYFSSHYLNREDRVADHRQSVLTRTEPLTIELKEASPGSAEEMKSLYRKLVVVITLMSGLGNPTNNTVLKEATAALHSVFPLSELTRFTTALSEEDKMKQIMELKQIVSGIRLFNKDSHKGGEGIDDMPSILQQAVVATKDQITQNIQQTEESVAQLSAWLARIYREELQDAEMVTVIMDKPQQLVDSDLALLKENSVHHVQYLIYLRALLEDVKACEQDIAVICARVSDRLFQLHDTVRYRNAIPTNQVYPQFMELSILWSGLQDQMVVLSTLSQILYSLQNISKLPDLPQEKKEVLDDLVKTMQLRPTSKNRKIRWSKVKCEVLELVNDEDYDPKEIQLLCHCAFRFVEMDGCLFPAELSLGLLRHKGLLFGFSSVEAAHAFGEDPDRYYQEGLQIVSQKPELIILFNMDEQIYDLKTVAKTASSTSVPKRDCETQTELHPIPSFKDPSYSWNIWDYKRRAIFLADMTKKKTHSSQTHESHFRLHASVQCRPVRHTDMQSSVNQSSNTAKPASYVVGLRGSWLKDQFEANNLRSYVPRCRSSEPH